MTRSGAMRAGSRTGAKSPWAGLMAHFVWIQQEAGPSLRATAGDEPCQLSMLDAVRTRVVHGEGVQWCLHCAMGAR